jgi:putative membrane protein
MRKSWLSLVAVIALLAFGFVNVARAGEPPAPPKEGAAPGGGDVKFANNAARDGEAEVILGKLAAEKGAAEEVKKFGQQMVDDHSKASEELKSLAQSKKLDLEKSIAAGTKKGERISQKLSKLEGAEFDKGYVGVMLKEHEAAVKLFQMESEKGQDAEIKAFAEKTLPTLQHHLEMVKELQSKVGKPAGGAGGGRGGQKPGGETEGAGPADKPAKEGTGAE